MYPRPRGEASRCEVGLFMFFAWPVLLVIGFIQLFFTVVGWLFEQAWFFVVLAIGLVVLIAASIIA